MSKIIYFNNLTLFDKSYFFIIFYVNTKMKNILLTLVFLIPLIGFSQSEEYIEKSQKRSEKYFNNQRNYYNPYLFRPYWSPIYTPSLYRPYYPNQNTNDLKTISIHIGFSNSFNTNPLFQYPSTNTTKSPYSFGVYMSFKGDNMVTLFDIEVSSQNPHKHYNNIGLGNVQYWNDEFMGEFTELFDFGIGLGPKLSDNFYPFIMGSIIGSKSYLIYFDETYVLSNNGKYTINGIESFDFNLGPGLLFNYKFFEIKTNYDLMTPKRFNVGLGFKLF